MSMRWEDERYVRVYTRDTITWKMLPWQAKCVFPLLLRVVDRAGLLDVGDYGTEGMAALLGIPEEIVTPGLEALTRRGVVIQAGGKLLIPNFLEAQEAAASDIARQRKARELARDIANRDRVLPDSPVTKRDEPSQNVTERHELSRAVTDGHEMSQAVTPSLPSLAVPSVPKAADEKPSAPRRAKRDKPPTDPRHRPLQDRLEVTFLEVAGSQYGHQGGRDATALMELLRLACGDMDDVDRRWRLGLRGEGWKRCATFGDLVRKWNEFAPGMARDPPTKGRATNADKDWSQPVKKTANGEIDWNA
jgi:hypothetical protein